MKQRISLTLLFALSAVLAVTSVSAEEAGHAEIQRQPWSFSGFTGQFDK
ncbi:MAG TPA: cytochrome c1, partial [Hyphomicrobium sp.]|nr:cytochrome c1 [Hyphomicrobium sp.]